MTDSIPPPEGDHSDARVLRSPALYLGEVVLPAEQPTSLRDLRRLSGRSLKNLLFPLFHGLFRNAPAWLALAPLRGAVGVARRLYGLRRNALRRACEDLAVIAGSRGLVLDPRQIYGAFLANALAVAEGYLALEREGVEAALDRVFVSEADALRMRRLLEEHGGGILAVGHNLGAVYTGARLSRAFPLVIVSKNSATAQRTRMAVALFERMGAQVLMVRGGRPTVLARAMIRALRERNMLIATVDNVDTGEAARPARIFGVEVGFSPWAAAIAAKRRVPVIPAWFAVDAAGTVHCRFGEALVTTAVDDIVQHYVQWFEERILEDPANWAYLADRKWRRVLAASADRLRAAPAAAAAGGREGGA